jgi:excinuclease ABC subunit A
MDKLIIKGAREHNLKNIDLELPRDKLIVIFGLFETGRHHFPSPKAGWIFHIG